MGSHRPKLYLTRELGGTYHNDNVVDVLQEVRPDVIMECTGASPIIIACLGRAGPNGILCLLGVSASSPRAELDMGLLNRSLVLQNQVVFGSVNANRRHYEAAATALAQADREWLARLITRRVPLALWAEALENRRDDIKVI